MFAGANITDLAPVFRINGPEKVDSVVVMTKFISTPFAAAGALFAAAAVSIATVVPAGAANESFVISSIEFTDSFAYDADLTAGDDRGFVALSGGSLLWRGDSAVVTVDGMTMTDGVASTNLIGDFDGAPGDLLLTDLSTEIAYDVIGVTSGDPETLFTATDVRPVGADAEYSGAAVSLSEDLTWEGYFDENLEEDHFCSYAASGWGRIAIWDTCTGVLYDIDPVTGVVTTVTDVATDATYPDINRNSGESDTTAVGAGVLEYASGVYSIVAPGYDGVNSVAGLYRFTVSDPSVPAELVLAFDSDYDLSSFVVSPAMGAWFVHVEGEMAESEDSVGMEEALIRFGGFTSSRWTMPEEEALAETGIEAGALAGAALMSILAGVVVAARRRVRA